MSLRFRSGCVVRCATDLNDDAPLQGWITSQFFDDDNLSRAEGKRRSERAKQAERAKSNSTREIICLSTIGLAVQTNQFAHSIHATRMHAILNQLWKADQLAIALYRALHARI